jgi:hypothetical protein
MEHLLFRNVINDLFFNESNFMNETIFILLCYVETFRQLGITLSYLIFNASL